MNKLKLFLIFLFPLFEATAQQHQQITLEQAIKLGLDNSKSLKISLAKADVADAKYKQAIDGVLPSVIFSAYYQRLSDIDEPLIKLPGFEPFSLFPVYVNNYSTRLSVNETIFSGFRLKYAEESQQLLQQAAKLDVNKDHDEIVYGIVQAYFNLYKIKESKKAVEENLEQIAEHVKESRNGEQQGTLTHNDVLRWELQQSNIELAKLDLENSESVANYNMNLMLGLNDIMIDPDSTSVQKLNEEKPLSDYMDRAASSRGDLQAGNLRMKASEDYLKISQNSFMPQVSVGASAYDMRPNPRVIPPEDVYTFTWDAGIFFTWDLVKLYSNKHMVAEAKANLTQNQESLNLLSDAVKMEVNQNYLSWKQSRQKTEVLQKSIEQAEENYRITNSRYKNNFSVLSDLLDADNMLLNAKINFALSKADSQVAYYRLMKSTGGIQ